MIKIKNYFGILFVSLLLINLSYAQLNATWYTKSLEVNVGDTVKIDLFIDPEPDHPVVTVSNTLNYDPDKLQFVETIFPDKWFVLSEEPNSITDEENGFIRRTAGVANGVSENSKYMTYVFEAVKEGEVDLFIEDGMVLDQENNDLGFQKKQMRINISPRSEIGNSASSTNTNIESIRVDSEPKVVTMGLTLFDKEVIVVSDKDWIDKNRNEIFILFGLIVLFAWIYHLHKDHIIFRKLRARSSEYHEILVKSKK